MKTIETLSIVAISLFVVLGLFLFSNRNAWYKGFIWIGTFFILLALNFLDGILLLRGSYASLPQFAFWEEPLALTYGPLIYFFGLRVKSQTVKSIRGLLPHLLPFLLLEALVLAMHIIFTNEQIRQFLNTLVERDVGPLAILGVIPIFIHVFTYVLLTRLNLKRHQEDLKHQFSSLAISWTFSLVHMILVIFLLSLLSTILQYLGTSGSYTIVLLVLILASILLTLRILLVALNQPLFPSFSKAESSVELTENEISSFVNQINILLGERKLFRNPDLTLKDLAAEIGISDRAVSYVINQSMAENFYDLINTFRIQEAQQILKQNTDQKQTVLEVLYEVGYNSKSSFNTQFKKKTGLTPSEFKRLHSSGE